MPTQNLNGGEQYQTYTWIEDVERLRKIFDPDNLLRWENEGGKVENRVHEDEPVDRSDTQPNLIGIRQMPVYSIGDTIVHWTYGPGKIIAIEDKGLPGEPCSYYIIEARQQMLWVPVEENGRSSLHRETSRPDFNLQLDILRSQGKEMPNNPYQRQSQLEERMQKASPSDLCCVIRDLTSLSHQEKLGSSDTRFLMYAQKLLLDEWELSLGTPRRQARAELESVLKETRGRRKITPAACSNE